MTDNWLRKNTKNRPLGYAASLAKNQNQEKAESVSFVTFVTRDFSKFSVFAWKWEDFVKEEERRGGYIIYYIGGNKSYY